MLQYLLAQIQSLMQTARDTYGVDPIIFLVLYFACVPVWYYSLFRTIRAVATRRGNAIMLWSAVFLASNVIPFVYVMLFGRNIPWWVYGLIAILIGMGSFSLVRKIREAPQVNT